MTEKEKAVWFDSATEFMLEGDIRLVMKSRKNGVGRWAIVNKRRKKIFNSYMEWEDELPMELRDAEYYKRTRFLFGNAIELFKAKKMKEVKQE